MDRGAERRYLGCLCKETRVRSADCRRREENVHAGEEEHDSMDPSPSGSSSAFNGGRRKTVASIRGDPPAPSHQSSSSSSPVAGSSRQSGGGNSIHSMSTAHLDSTRLLPQMPPSALRNGSINNMNSNSSGYAQQPQHVNDLRNKRLANTRRIYASQAEAASPGQAPPSSRDRQGGMNISLMPFVENANSNSTTSSRGRKSSSSKGRSRRSRPGPYSNLTLVATLGFVCILGAVYHHPVMRKSFKSASVTRVLKLASSSSPAEGDKKALPTAVEPVDGRDFLDDFHSRRRRAADLADGTVFTEPAHTRMCRAIIDRLDQLDAGVTTFERAVFTESEYVCRDPDTPYTALMNMFAAELLHEANNALGLSVDYTHRCARWERYCSGNMTTVQMHLPDPLAATAGGGYDASCLDADALRAICADSMASDDPGNPDNILFPNGYVDTSSNSCGVQCHFSNILPWIRDNLRTVASDWLHTVETRALTFWLRNAAEFSHREKDDMEVSVVSLSCANSDCDMSMETCVCEFDPLPNWIYGLHIPRSSTNVAIIVSPTCAKFGVGCTLHAQEIYHFFHTLFPRSDVTYDVITSTSSWYMRMITADHLICPPGEGCLLPAMARDAYTYVYESVVPTVSTWITCTPDDYLNRMTLPIFPPAFMEGDCRHLRARVGQWAPDMALAADMQYTTPVNGYLGCADTNFEATATEPYRSPTTYRWDESVWGSCPVGVMTKDDLCAQMDALSLKRILFVGDHTAMTQAISLASMLGHNENISLNTNVVPNFSKTINCPNTNIASFELSFIRNDRLEEPGTEPSPGFPNCGPSSNKYCYAWSSDYANFSGKQLLVVNTGYHWDDDWQGYIANFQNFVGKIDEMAAANSNRAEDVIMFRTSVPGHKDCDVADGIYNRYSEYCPRIVNGAFWHWWGELPPFNDYAIRIINEWNLLNTVKSGPDIELLDPWMMTILRPDGHLSGPDAGETCEMGQQECMLYSLPGPVDWWNHLLVMQLRDIATHTSINSPTIAFRR